MMTKLVQVTGRPVIVFPSHRVISNMSEANQLSRADKIEKARDLKDQGNDHYKKGDLRTAIKRYHTALLYIRGANEKSVLGVLGLENEGESSSEHKLFSEGKILEFSCNNNLAACHLKKRDYEKVVLYSTKALDYQSDSVKALFRRGQAFFELKNIENAKKDFEEVLRLDPKETAVRRYLVAIEAKEKENLAKEKEMYSAMFQKMSQSS